MLFEASDYKVPSVARKMSNSTSVQYAPRAPLDVLRDFHRRRRLLCYEVMRIISNDGRANVVGSVVRSFREQDYHGVVKSALGWACRKTHVGRPRRRVSIMHGTDRTVIRSHRFEDALSVQEAQLSCGGASAFQPLLPIHNLHHVFTSRTEGRGVSHSRDVYFDF